MTSTVKHEGTFQVTTPTDREIAWTRVFDAPRGLVFEAHTKPDLLKRWLLGPPGWTMPICEIDLRVGGTYRYGWASGDGKAFEMHGIYREVVVPEKIVTTEYFGGGEALCTLVLTEDGGATRLSHTMLFSSPEERDGAMKSGMTRGVGQSYDRLADVMSAPEGKTA